MSFGNNAVGLLHMEVNNATKLYYLAVDCSGERVPFILGGVFLSPWSLDIDAGGNERKGNSIFLFSTETKYQNDNQIIPQKGHGLQNINFWDMPDWN